MVINSISFLLFFTLFSFFIGLFLIRQLNNKIELTMISPPLHSYYKRKTPVRFVKKFNFTMNKHKLNVIDLSEIPLNDTCYLPDGSHVTEYGALLTTNELNNRINKRSIALNLLFVILYKILENNHEKIIHNYSGIQ